MRDPSLPGLFVTHWQLAWSLDVQGAVYAGLYLWGAARVRGRWPVQRTASFLGGIGCVLLALQSGIDAYSQRLLSVHMVQHTLLLLVAPLLLLCGRPLILALRALPPAQRPGLARLLARVRPFTKWWLCIVVWYAVVLLTHLPSFYDATLSHPALHEGEHALYLLAGLLLWWPLLDGDPVPAHRLGGLGRLCFLLAAMAPMALVGAYLNRHPTVVYAPYGATSHALGIPAVVDQQHAGAIMWVAGDMIMTLAGLAATLAALLAEERRQKARDARSGAILLADRGAEGGATL